MGSVNESNYVIIIKYINTSKVFRRIKDRNQSISNTTQTHTHRLLRTNIMRINSQLNCKSMIVVILAAFSIMGAQWPLLPHYLSVQYTRCGTEHTMYV